MVQKQLTPTFPRALYPFSRRYQPPKFVVFESFFSFPLVSLQRREHSTFLILLIFIILLLPSISFVALETPNPLAEAFSRHWKRFSKTYWWFLWYPPPSSSRLLQPVAVTPLHQCKWALFSTQELCVFLLTTSGGRFRAEKGYHEDFLQNSLCVD